MTPIHHLLSRSKILCGFSFTRRQVLRTCRALLCNSHSLHTQLQDELSIPISTLDDLSTAIRLWSDGSLPEATPELKQALSSHIELLCEPLRDIKRSLGALSALETSYTESQAILTDDVAAADPEFTQLVAEEAKHFAQLYTERERDLSDQICVLSDAIAVAPLGAPVVGVEFQLSAGTGGDEAQMFASELQEAYRKWFVAKGWRVAPFQAASVLAVGSTSHVGAGTQMSGFRVSAHDDSIGGPSWPLYKVLLQETGVHRVQRIPSNSTVLQTSAAVVTITPVLGAYGEHRRSLFSDDEIQLTYTRASSNGGQRAQRAENGCRLHHLPTHTLIYYSGSRSATENRLLALKDLDARLQHRQGQYMDALLLRMTSDQVGGSDRSDKIRTYSFASHKTTDHRLSKEYVVDTDRVIDDGEFDVLSDALMARDWTATLKSAPALLLDLLRRGPPPPPHGPLPRLPGISDGDLGCGVVYGGRKG